MESTDENLEPAAAKSAGEFGRPGKLIGLDTRKRDDGSAGRQSMGSDYFLNRDFFYSVVKQLYFKLDAAQLPALGDIPGKAGKAGKGIAGENSAEMADDVSFVVVFRRLYDDDS